MSAKKGFLKVQLLIGERGKWVSILIDKHFLSRGPTMHTIAECSTFGTLELYLSSSQICQSHDLGKNVVGRNYSSFFIRNSVFPHYIH